MASSKVMASTSNPRNSDLSPASSLPPSHHHHHHHHHQNHNHHHLDHHQPSSPSTMISDFSPNSARLDLPMIYADTTQESSLLDAEIALIDAAGAISAVDSAAAEPSGRQRKTVDEVWREIVSERKECKMEAPDEMMTLEDFLAKAGAEVDDDEVEDSKNPQSLMALGGSGGSGGGLFGFDQLVQGQGQGQGQVSGSGLGSGSYAVHPGMGEAGVMGFGNGGGVEVSGVGGRGKRRGGPILEPLDKAAQQRQRRMIKNRESAARSRERKQAYLYELESLAVKLGEENEKLLREKAEWTKERYKQLMEKVVPVVEKRQPSRVLRRVCSTQW